MRVVPSIKTPLTGLLTLISTLMLFTLPAPGMAAIPDWSDYNSLLQRYVSPSPDNGARVNLVRYSRLARNPEFKQVVDMIESYPLENLETDAEQLSFYINAYNIFAIKMVLDHWPIKSIKAAGSLMNPVWYREVGVLGGKPVTLDDVLHKIIRPMGEPLAHFGLNCASRGCPELRREAYVPDRLQQQLEGQLLRFLKIRNGFRRLDKIKSVRVAKHFRWYRKDFEEAGGVSAFLRRYVEFPENYKVFANITYDWDLNGK